MSIKVRTGNNDAVELNTLELQHEGLRWRYTRDIQGPVIQLSVEEKEPVMILFDDTYEIDMLIVALAQFKEQCKLNSGKLVLTQSMCNPTRQEVEH